MCPAGVATKPSIAYAPLPACECIIDRSGRFKATFLTVKNRIPRTQGEPARRHFFATTIKTTGLAALYAELP